MKGDYPYGEREILSQLPNVTMVSSGSGEFIDPANIKSQDREAACSALAQARQAIQSGQYDVVVLDEVNLAASWGLVSLEEVIQIIRDKPEKVELILTGRQAHQRLVELADLVTECQNIKHPYNRGIKARKGLEY